MGIPPAANGFDPESGLLSHRHAHRNHRRSWSGGHEFNPRERSFSPAKEGKEKIGTFRRALYRLLARRRTLRFLAVAQAAVIIGLLYFILSFRTEISRGIPEVEFVADAHSLSHLILVPGHAITVREFLRGADKIDDVWYLLDYQHAMGVPRELVRHIQEGVKAAAADPSSLLLFSGGATRRVAGPRTEGGSYFTVADHFGWWGSSNVRARAAAEEFARDSLENLMFSICRFKELTGGYPKKITVVGYSFKRRRFESVHRSALRFPREQFSYIAVEPGEKFELSQAVEGEITSSLIPFRKDPYGCVEGGALARKREERNPFHRSPPYAGSCPEMAELLQYCGTPIFAGHLPWSAAGAAVEAAPDWAAEIALGGGQAAGEDLAV